MVVEIGRKNRVTWIDCLKGLSVILVGINHAVMTSKKMDVESSSRLFDLIIHGSNFALDHARLPAFFLASGIIIASIKVNKTEWFLTKRLPFMLWIIMIWTAISFLVETLGLHLYPFRDFPFFSDGYALFSPYGILWFVYALLFVSALTVIVQNLSKVYQLIITAVLSVSIHYYLKYFEFDLHINNWLFVNLAYKGLPFFMAGYIFKEQILRFFESKLSIIVLAMVTVVTTSALIFLVLPEVSNYQRLFFRYTTATFLFVSSVVLMSKLSWFNSIFARIGQISLEFFILHQFFIALIFRFYDPSYLGYGYIFDKLMLILSPILLCLLFIFTLNPVIKPVFFTIPKVIANPLSALIIKKT